MKSRRAALIAVVALLAGACGGSSGASPAASAAVTPAESSSASTAPSAEGSAPAVTGVEFAGMVGGPGGMNEIAQGAIDKFNAATGNKMSLVQGTSGESPFQQLAAMYASGSVPAVISVDLADVAKLTEKVADLSNEKWVADANPQLIRAVTADGKIMAMPGGVVSAAFLYNGKVIEAATGTAFDPSTIKTQSDLKALFEQIRAGGVAPIVVSPLNWSLGAHYLQKLYDAQGDEAARAAFVDALKAGSVDLTQDAVFNGLIDTFDVMKEYNLNAATPLTGTQETDAQAFVDGKAAFWFMGNFAWALMNGLGAQVSDDYGMVGVPISDDAANAYNQQLWATAVYPQLIDTTMSTPDQQAAAKAWMDWYVYTPEGQDYMVNGLQAVPAFKNVTLPPPNPVAKSLATSVNDGNVYVGFLDIPGDHWQVLGDEMLKYLDGKIDRAGLAKAIQEYWAAQS